MPALHFLCSSPQPSPQIIPVTPKAGGSSNSNNLIKISSKPPINPTNTKHGLVLHTSIQGAVDDQTQQVVDKVSLELKEKILCLEVMGVDSGRAMSLNPSLLAASLLSVHSVVSYLASKGIHHKDLARIFGMCPSLLTSDVRTQLAPVFAFLTQELGVPDSKLRKVINKCPRLLVCSVRDQLKPALFFLRRLGFKDVRALAYQDPILLVSSVENTLIPKLKYLASLGYSRAETVGMVLRCPDLFTYSVDSNLKPKFEYYMHYMSGSLEELKAFPHYFGFSLDKRIVPRQRASEERGLRLPLPTLLKSSEEEFEQLLR